MQLKQMPLPLLLLFYTLQQKQGLFLSKINEARIARYLAQFAKELKILKLNLNLKCVKYRMKIVQSS